MKSKKNDKDIYLLSTSSKKFFETYKKQLEIANPKYINTLNNATKTLKLMNISEKLKLSTPTLLYNSERIANMLKNSPFNSNLKNLLPSDTMLSQIKAQLIQPSLSPALSAAIKQIQETQRMFIQSFPKIINDNISPALKAFSDSIEQLKNNPDSIFSWMNYYDKLSEFFWIMPYQITTDELHEILQNAKTEKEFDHYINRYFNKAKVNSLISDIKEMLSNNNQRKVFNQIITTAFVDKSYALASIGITTMIDNSLSYYLIDKGCTSRLKLFEPIINDLDLKRENSDFSFIVMMVNSNINLLYEPIEFNNKISIETNKKSRRNPISHGKSYSYKKIDTIMLLNTLYYLLVIQGKLKQYKNSLYRNSRKKEFYIATKKEKQEIMKKIKNKLIKQEN